MRKIILLLLLLSQIVSAKAKTPKKITNIRKPSQQEGVTLYGEAISEDYPMDQMDPSLKRPTEPQREVLNPAQTSFVLSKAQLFTETQNWDHLEKDILIVRTKKYSLNELKNYYPQIQPNKLLQLKTILLGK
jgi:hypothetical protein